MVLTEETTSNTLGFNRGAEQLLHLRIPFSNSMAFTLILFFSGVPPTVSQIHSLQAVKICINLVLRIHNTERIFFPFSAIKLHMKFQ